MNDPLAIREWTLRARTPIWTGDANRNGDRLILSGVLGSIRWWFEVAVRGLSGTACDPSFEDRKNPKCSRCPERSVKLATNSGHHCVVCELFGCTGWSRKFRFQVLDKDEKVFQNAIKANDTFHLRFVPLRPIRDEEWELLDVTLRLIADYGVLGGKTVLKPSDEVGRQNEPHHKDYGLVQIVQAPAFERRFSSGESGELNARSGGKPNGIPGLSRTPSERSDARFSIVLESVRLRQEKLVRSAAEAERR